MKLRPVVEGDAKECHFCDEKSYSADDDYPCTDCNKPITMCERHTKVGMMLLALDETLNKVTEAMRAPGGVEAGSEHHLVVQAGMAGITVKEASMPVQGPKTLQ